MVFESTISIGNLLTIASMLVVALGFMWRGRQDFEVTRMVTSEQIKQIEAKLLVFVDRFRSDDEREQLRFDRMEQELKQISGQMMQVVRQDERLNHLEQRITDLTDRIAELANRFSQEMATVTGPGRTRAGKRG